MYDIIWSNSYVPFYRKNVRPKPSDIDLHWYCKNIRQLRKGFNSAETKQGRVEFRKKKPKNERTLFFLNWHMSTLLGSFLKGTERAGHVKRPCLHAKRPEEHKQVLFECNVTQQTQGMTSWMMLIASMFNNSSEPISYLSSVCSN